MTRSRMWNAGTAAVVVLVLIAGWFLAIAPQRSAAAESRSSAEAAADQNRTTERKIAALKLAQKDVPKQIAEIAAIREQLPSQAAQPALLRQIADIVEDSGAEVFKVTPSPIEALEGVDGVRFVTVGLEGRGTYEMLQLFLDQMELNKRAMLITSFDIGEAQPRDGEDDADVAGVLAINVTMRVFMSDPTTTAAGDTSGAAASTPGAPGEPAAPSATTETN